MHLTEWLKSQEILGLTCENCNAYKDEQQQKTKLNRGLLSLFIQYIVPLIYVH